MSFKDKVKLYSAHRSGGICAHPECQERLTQGPTDDESGVVIGEAAHIFGEKKGSARFDPTKSPEFLGSAENLIFLCPTHHTLIDKQRETYTVEKLFDWKLKHEIRMQEATSEVAVVTYDELQIATESHSSKSLLNEVQVARSSEEYKVGIQNGSGVTQDILTPTLADFGGIDQEVRRRVLGYSQWYDPASKTRILEKLNSFGYDQTLVENNAQRLEANGLIQITESHYLPLNAEVCQQAAETLMAEILLELEE